MPRCVRNFWIELDVDGRKHQIATGPKGSGGGFRLVIRHRAKGEICPVRHEILGFMAEGHAHLCFSRLGGLERWSEILEEETCATRS